MRKKRVVPTQLRSFICASVLRRLAIQNGARVRVRHIDAGMMHRATTERSSSHQSTTGAGGGARSEGLLIKPTVYLLAAPSSVANRFPCVLRRSSIKRGLSLQRRLLNDFISKNPLRRVSLLQGLAGGG